ncbi:hypothetical protein [Nocardia sp. alder85J]|uniref:hypothetical protein n=1 Tax=Nocardia sp. alder85J TaxID=2862949 RepID=UPI001CD658C6|nr:hypothetical protein [Nocardia sp. alder85J]MCX4097296.1 hypothetical protein [Nocardia sp. alder85J]
MAGVEINDRFVRRTLDNGRIEEVAWQDLSEVRIISTSDGPFTDVVFYVLIGTRGNGCVVPRSAADSKFLDRLRRLPGFDGSKVAHALGTGVNQRLWRRN